MIIMVDKKIYNKSTNACHLNSVLAYFAIRQCIVCIPNVCKVKNKIKKGE